MNRPTVPLVIYHSNGLPREDDTGTFLDEANENSGLSCEGEELRKRDEQVDSHIESASERKRACLGCPQIAQLEQTIEGLASQMELRMDEEKRLYREVHKQSRQVRIVSLNEVTLLGTIGSLARLWLVLVLTPRTPHSTVHSPQSTVHTPHGRSDHSALVCVGHWLFLLLPSTRAVPKSRSAAGEGGRHFLPAVHLAHTCMWGNGWTMVASRWRDSGDCGFMRRSPTFRARLEV